MKQDLDRSDPEFLKDLQESDIYVMLAGLWLLQEGYNVTFFATQVRPDPEKRFEFADEGDLEIWSDTFPTKTRVEVKHNHHHFTNDLDYPFKDVLVETQQKMDNLKYKGELDPRPFLILRFNQSLSHCLLIKPSTKYLWTANTFLNKKTNRAKPCYFVPKDKVEYKALPPYMEAWKKALLNET